MAKTWTYVFIMIGLMVLLNVSGVIQTSESQLMSSMFDSSGHIKDYSDWTIYTKIMTLLIAFAGIGAIGAGFGLVRGYLEGVTKAFYLVSSGSIFVLFLSDMFKILNKVETATGAGCSGLCGDWIYYIVLIIFVPIIGGFIWSIVEWIMGGGD